MSATQDAGRLHRRTLWSFPDRSYQARRGGSLATRSWTREGLRFVRSGQQFSAFQELAHNRVRPEKSHHTLVLLNVQVRTQHQNSGVREGFRTGKPPAFCGNHALGQRLGSRWLGFFVAAPWWRPDLRPCQRRSNRPWLFSATPRSGNPSRGSPRCGEGAGRRWVSGAGNTSQGCCVFSRETHPGTLGARHSLRRMASWMARFIDPSRHCPSELDCNAGCSSPISARLGGRQSRHLALFRGRGCEPRAWPAVYDCDKASAALADLGPSPAPLTYAAPRSRVNLPVEPEPLRCRPQPISMVTRSEQVFPTRRRPSLREACRVP
jgi:hypothetical protein